jgi:hypothetical protein
MKSWRKAIVGTQATVGEAIAAIESGSIQVALVLDGANRLLGIVTDGDIRRGLLRGIPLSGLATDVMNRAPVSAPATLSREERLHLMRQKFIKQLPLLDGSGQLIGVETFDELIEAPQYPNPVLIMAGGLGERLGALTRDRPKPMLDVGGRPLLETFIITRDEKQPVKPVTYSVIKHGLIGLTKYLATYWADQGVRVNAISPGGVFNNQDPAFVEKLTRLVPMGRTARVDEYCAAIQFLCSDASSDTTGQNLVIDGGRSVW